MARKIARTSAPRQLPLTRRRFIEAGGAAGAMLVMNPSAQAATMPLEAYASATSVKPGAKIVFYVRDPAGSMTVAKSVAMGIARIGVTDTTVMTGTVSVKNAAVPATAYSTGCGWAATTTVTVPTTWTSGLYYAVFGSGATFCTVPFVVRPATKTAAAKVLVQIPVTTAQAYNNYGGKSLYDYNSSGAIPATQVSFNRPHSDPGNFAFDPWQAPFVRWLAKQGIAADFCTSVDLH